MQTLRIFENAVEAEILRTRLDAAGILAVVNGSEVATMLSHIGTAAVRVRVEVAEEDYDRALAVLHEDDLDRLQRKPWTCGRCNEPNEPLFDLCWYCGKRWTDPDAQSPGDDLSGDDSPESAVLSEDDRPPVTVERPAGRKRPDSNPYAPSLLGPDQSGSRSVPEMGMDQQAVTELHERAARLFRGAVIGCVLIPPLLSIYVLTQLIFNVPSAAYRFPLDRRRFVSSWFLCLLSIAIWSVVWFQLYF